MYALTAFLHVMKRRKAELWRVAPQDYHRLDHKLLFNLEIQIKMSSIFKWAICKMLALIPGSSNPDTFSRYSGRSPTQSVRIWRPGNGKLFACIATTKEFRVQPGSWSVLWWMLALTVWIIILLFAFVFKTCSIVWLPLSLFSDGARFQDIGIN